MIKMIGLNNFLRRQIVAKKFISPLTSIKTPFEVLDKGYRNTLQLALVGSLLFHIGLFGLSPKKLNFSAKSPEIASVELVAEEITPPTEQQSQLGPPPPRPAVPIPVDNDEIPEDLTITETELDFDEVPPPPPAFEDSDDIESGYVFVSYDRAPEIIGGIASLQKYLQYPELARLAGVEGRVIVGVLVDEQGNSVKTTILKASGTKTKFEEAAQAAVLKLKWKPAMQRDKPVKVWISLPVHFRLQVIEKST